MYVSTSPGHRLVFHSLFKTTLIPVSVVFTALLTFAYFLSPSSPTNLHLHFLILLGFKHLLEFKKEFGHTKVPVFYTGYNNLGRWAKRMRDGIRNNEPWMDDVRKSRLLGIEFDIAARHVFGEKTKLELEQQAVDNDAAVLQQPNIGMSVEMPSLETQAVLAATTMAAMDNNDIRMNPPPGTLFYHNYADPQQEPL